MGESQRFSLGDSVGKQVAENIRSAAGLLKDAVPDVNNLQTQIHIIRQLFESIDTQLQLTKDIIAWRNEALVVILELEDLLDEFVVLDLAKKSCSGVYYKLFGKKSICKLTLMITALADRLKLLAKSLELLDTHKADWKNDPCSNRDVFVGRGEDLAKLRSGLVENSDVCVVGVVGMGGSGKTSLAKMVYLGLLDDFDRIGWINLTNKVELKSLLRELALQLTLEEDDKVMGLSEVDLLLQLHKVQLEKRCLIVLDDVWSTDAWLNLRLAFPSKESGTVSKVLITTRIGEVGRMVAADSGIVHVLNGLSDHESWELISRIAPLPPDIKVDASCELIGKEIARKCHGLPLAIILLGKHLSRMHTMDGWIALKRNIVFDKSRGEHERDVIHQLLAISFMDLPLNLKHCLLYLAGFSENSEIDTDMLYMLWIAEGMVQSGYGRSTRTVIEIADRYLQELASRGMVEVQEDDKSRVRKFRSCRLNSMIRDMCLLRAKEENFLMVMDLRRHKQSTLGSYKYFSTDKVRKLAVHLDGNKDGCSISFGLKKTEKIRSLLLTKTSLSQDKLLEEESPLMLKFKVLRVLHLDGLNFGPGKLPKEIKKLAFLRYLSLRNCYLKTLPSSISNLLNLQTLDLRVRERCLMTIYNVLWKMEHMKHLYLPQLFRVHNDEKLRLDTLRELETLKNFNSKLCVAVDLLQMINLRFLTASVHENLEDLEATIKCINKTSSYLCEASLDIRSFHCYPKGKQSAIQKLFQCNALNTLHLEGYLGKLPVIASSSLSEMLFSSSEFNQDPMPMLGKLPNLRVLILYNYAFIGKKLVCPTPSFNELRHLKLSTLPNLEDLIVEEGTMPKLSGLTIVECQNLKLHPNQLKIFKNLKETKISRIAMTFEGLKYTIAM